MRKILASCCLLSFLIVCAAQNNKNKTATPDLNGLWILDQSRSNITSLSEDFTDYRLVIVQHEPEIHFRTKYKQDAQEIVRAWVYYTDGRPTKLQIAQNNTQRTEISTHWHDNKLFRRITTSRKNSFSNFPDETVTQEEWVLSNDRQTLTRTISKSSTGSPGRVREPLNEKYVFTRH